jgi:hypothetical protein
MALRFFGGLLLVLGLAVYTGAGANQDTGEPMLLAAAETTDLTSTGTPSYHLHAHFKFLVERDNQPANGELKISFVSPSRWREEISWAGATTIEGIADDRSWSKDADARRLDVLRLDRVLDFSKLLLPVPGGRVSKPREKQLDGKTAECLKSTTNGSVPLEVCLDSVSRLPVTVKDHDLNVKLDFGASPYFSLGTRRFPNSIRYGENDRVILEMDIDSLEVIESPSQESFAPPSAAQSVPWCPHERTPVPLNFSNTGTSQLQLPGLPPLTIIDLPIADFPLLVFDVGSDGRVKDLKAYDKRGSIHVQDSAIVKLRDSSFRPAMCKGQAVEGEFIIWTSHR